MRRVRDGLPLVPFLTVVVIFLIIPTVTVVVSAVYVDGAFSLDRLLGQLKTGRQPLNATVPNAA